VQNLRKEADFNVNDRITLYYDTDGDLAEAIMTHSEYIKLETLSTDLQKEVPPTSAHASEFKLGGHAINLGISR